MVWLISWRQKVHTVRLVMSPPLEDDERLGACAARNV
jgi:hypothetical protein